MRKRFQKCFFCFTHQSLVLKRIVDAPEEKPKGPKVLEAKLEKVIGEQNHRPKQKQLDVDQRSAKENQ